jgi:hypothetical protein
MVELDEQTQKIVDAINKKTDDTIDKFYQTLEELDDTYEVVMRCLSMSIIMELLDLAKLKGVTFDEEVEHFCQIIKMAHKKPEGCNIIPMFAHGDA